MTVITIRGQLGSGAPQIGRICANELGLDYYDHDIINRIADRLGVPRQQIIAKEILPVTFKERIARLIKNDYNGAGTVNHPYPGEEVPPLDHEHYMKGLRSVIRGLARTEAAVINGRGSQFFLKYHPGALHVLTVAPLELRVKRVMETYSIDEHTARTKIHRYDTSRRVFIKSYFKEDLENPVHYDITINTGDVDPERAVSLIVRAVRLKNRIMSQVS